MGGINSVGKVFGGGLFGGRVFPDVKFVAKLFNPSYVHGFISVQVFSSPTCIGAGHSGSGSDFIISKAGASVASGCASLSWHTPGDCARGNRKKKD